MCVAHAELLHGARTVLEFPSVGATENLMCAAVLAKGTTVIENAAREPEVTALATFLNRMGAHLLGAGSSTIEIEGVEELHAVDSEIMADRVEAGTLLMACGIAGGEIELVGVRSEHVEMVSMKLCEMGMRISPTSDGLWALAEHAPAGGRRRDVAAPRFRHRLHAAGGRADDRGRRQRDRHRERLRRPLPVRRRARPHGRRRADRGPARDRPGRRAALRARPCRPPTCGPARPSSWPAWSPTARRSCTTASTSSGATPTSPGRLRSLGADVERLDD